jgi:hypothetical protein
LEIIVFGNLNSSAKEGSLDTQSADYQGDRKSTFELECFVYGHAHGSRLEIGVLRDPAAAP